MRSLCRLLLAALCLLLASTALSLSSGVAEATVEVDALTHALPLDDRVALLRDPEGELDLEAARARDAEFQRHHGELSFGFDSAAIWMRFSVHNRESKALPWLLEITEPSLDHVDVYLVHADGRVNALHGGDALPFATRALGHANFVFPFTTAPGEQTRYYVRVRSGDILRAPMRAWSVRAYDADHERDTFLHALCTGALVLVALYHFGVFWLVRQVENVWFALVALSLGAVLLSFEGRVGQFFLPRDPALANRMPALTIAVAMVTVAFFTYAATAQLKTQPALSRVLQYVAQSSLGLLGVALLLPPGIALRIEYSILFVLTLSGPYLLRIAGRLEIPELRLYSLGWYALIVAIPVSILRYTGVFTDNVVTRWAMPLGFVAYGVLNSLALAALASRLRRQLATMNDRLTHNVEELRMALLHAEQANQKAQRATEAKDEFLATMSHELRTPLNTIINIPQGLIDEFEHVRAATCGHCDATFLLDEKDVLGADTACESCGRVSTLAERTKVRFHGDEARTLRFLQKIERSGQHLLQMVSGVLDYSKLEAGRFQLALAPVDLDGLIHEVADQMSDLALTKQISLEVHSCPRPDDPVLADSLRLKQVLINLIANAIKFSEPETRVTVRWRPAEHADLIEVTDQGIGIAPEDHERVFASFEQVHTGATRRYGGTGLGLSISRSLVRLHAGELYVRSELGKGSTFIVSLPRMTTGNVSLPGAGSVGRGRSGSARPSAAHTAAAR
jgi:two-component system, sensor histidine kinase LadS